MNSYQPVRKIMCAIDLSEHSRAVVDESFHLAEKLGAELLILNIIDERRFEGIERMSGRFQSMDNVVEHVVNSMEEEHAQQLKEWLSGTDERGVKHASLITAGLPWEKILEKAEAENIDLIVMGAKGHGSIARQLRFGSTAEKVFRRASCRVLFVR